MSLGELTSALRSTGGFEVLSENATDTQVRLVGRLLSRDYTDRWLIAMQHLLSASLGAEWKVDVSKQYMLQGNKVFYAWRLIFQASSEVSKHYSAIGGVIATTPRPRLRELDEIALPGAKSTRNMHTQTGKGAAIFGKGVTGPEAVRRSRG